MTKFLILMIVLNASICHKIGVQPCGYPSTGIQFQLFIIGYLVSYNSGRNHAHN